MATSLAGLRIKNDWAGKDQQQLADGQKELSDGAAHSQSSNTEKHGHETCGLRSNNDCAGKSQQQFT
jgi:hypothetical protein